MAANREDASLCSHETLISPHMVWLTMVGSSWLLHWYSAPFVRQTKGLAVLNLDSADNGTPDLVCIQLTYIMTDKVVCQLTSAGSYMTDLVNPLLGSITRYITEKCEVHKLQWSIWLESLVAKFTLKRLHLLILLLFYMSNNSQISYFTIIQLFSLIINQFQEGCFFLYLLSEKRKELLIKSSLIIYKLFLPRNKLTLMYPLFLKGITSSSHLKEEFFIVDWLNKTRKRRQDATDSLKLIKKLK